MFMQRGPAFLFVPAVAVDILATTGASLVPSSRRQFLFQPVDPKITEQFDEGTCVERVGFDAHQVGGAGTARRTEPGDRPLTDRKQRLRQFVLQGPAGSDGDGRAPVRMGEQVIHLPG